MTVHLNIGSNICHRRSAIERAVAALSEALPGEMAVSDSIETEAWGFESAHPFLNVGVSISLRAALAPEEVLRRVQRAERSVSAAPHRNADGTYRDREIDIDIIAIDGLEMDTPGLTLPHPLMHLREFVLRPLAELAPAWCHPRFGLTPKQLLERLKSSQSGQ
ncbi:MAG: 2-amino-4-hydroxy-6-hydroxymethyldihydropteridine diphosphokinase [Duncaniella sp.]|nr:2-amino-4-hydroxy-6-hydroxymethyldihydropteridine diphosphokinase [Duncaniella sp.]